MTAHIRRRKLLGVDACWWEKLIYRLKTAAKMLSSIGEICRC